MSRSLTVLVFYCIHDLIVQLGSHPLHEAVIFRRQKMLRTLLHYRRALRLDVNITNKVRFGLIMMHNARKS